MLWFGCEGGVDELVAASSADQGAAAGRLAEAYRPGKSWPFGAVAGHDEGGGAGLAQVVRSGSYRAREEPAVRRAMTK